MSRRRAAGRDGFTLVETLVALAVIAMVSVVSVRGIVVARLGLERAQATIAAEAVARSIVETELDRLATAPGVVNGSTDGIDWTVTAELLDLPLPAPPVVDRAAAPRQQSDVGDGSQEPAEGQPAAPPAKWLPLRVLVRVANGRGRPLTVEAIHLARAQ